MEVRPHSYFPVVWIFLRSLGVICHDRWVLSEGHKNYFKDWCLINSQPIFLFFSPNLNLINYGYIIKVCKPDNFELHNSLKLRFTNIQGLRSNFVNLSMNQTLLTFLLCMRQIWVTQFILSYLKKLIFRKLCRFLLMFSYWLYFPQCLTSFSSINHLLRLCVHFLILFHPT